MNQNRCHGHDLPGQNIVAHVCTDLCTHNECCRPTFIRKGLNTRIAEKLDAAGIPWSTTTDDGVLRYVIDIPNARTMILTPGTTADWLGV